ncbi:hypothetical protein M2451_000409 [Dysgonomonas sp. PFB1-18]|uniref:porin family protein n=1 Tax=unclassified Dysgonomonas TaxID=2630389 RepID=UPI002473C1F2|nr:MULTISPECIES: porin family protein [unclassified Dysgonomonas]MDH6307260.1 hypothetical protein [Dysgonomonas sp. PF1-14]MDH6337178.1 hypothetical protein [Dysgonomonas sp. PF1-16]MDH6379102.1 hypothetical protein [Dysgonomonas sp. PFB1-18]MDH6396261.1 hypothetical protein [Dysgonomonas sp. PF1-23]
MKKLFKTIFVTITLFIGINASAQDKPITFGVKSGLNLSNYSGDAENLKAKLGFNVGVTLDYNFTSNLYLTTGLEFTTKGVKYDFEESITEEGQTFDLSAKAKINAMYLQIPIHIGYKVDVNESTKITFHAGPYIAYGVGGKVKIGDEMKIKNGATTVTINMKELKKEFGISDEELPLDMDTFGDESFKRFDFGVGLGVGAEFGKFCVGLGYDFGLANISREGSTARNMNAYLTVGYKF